MMWRLVSKHVAGVMCFMAALETDVALCTFSILSTVHCPRGHHLLSDWEALAELYFFGILRAALGIRAAVCHRAKCVINPLASPEPRADEEEIVGLQFATGPFFCTPGTGAFAGRNIAMAHLKACVAAGIRIGGVNSEGMLGQNEYQVRAYDMHVTRM